MILHLNQFGFYRYGVREPDRKPEEIRRETTLNQKVLLNWEKQTVYQAVSETHILPDGSMTVLAVSADGEKYESYYLDQPVCICADHYFYLAPLRREQASAELCMDIAPRVVDTEFCRGSEHVQSNMRVSGIYTFFYHEKEKGFFFAGEQHPVLELTYVDKGTMHSVTDGQELVLEQGDMVLYGSNQWHMQYADTDVSPHCLRVFFEMSGSLKGLQDRKFTATGLMEPLFAQLLLEQERRSKYADEMILALLNQLIVLLMRQVETMEPVDHRMKGEYRIIRQMQIYVSTHIWEDLSVPFVARHVNMSPSYLTALFHKHLDIAPAEYIRRVKLQESKHMIRENKLNFTEIAAELQYSTVHHFSRQFKEKFGMTPTEYAKLVR